MPKHLEKFLETDWITKTLLLAFVGLLTWNLKTTYDLSLTVSQIYASSEIIDQNFERRLNTVEEIIRE